jgi:16S rRNA (cytosine1402-N4)-methyltransferase
MSKYHTPVLLNECLEGLSISPEGSYVDVTFGGGGHSKEILKNLSSGRLIGFDQDTDALENTLNDERFTLVNQNFKFLKNFLRLHRAIPVQGILADLGVSSHQFDTGERGFSTRFDGPLDMRMNNQSPLTAAKVLNSYTEEQLSSIFFLYGEVKNARRLAADIVSQRAEKTFETTTELKAVCQNLVSGKKINQYLAQVFQALRIEVNQELETLKSLLTQSLDVLDQGGRLVIISYHSLEDRLVKNFFKTGNFEGKQEKDFFGKLIRPLNPINNRVIIPTEEEIERNSRARSAKLRIAEKL